MATKKSTKRAALGVAEKSWRWFGLSGHFICGQWCEFHLCTQVGQYLISTVGRYVHPRHSAGSETGYRAYLRANPNGEQIGADRCYETMVFVAGDPCVDPRCACGQPSIDGSELDFGGYNTAGAATEGHLALCRKWAKRRLPKTSRARAARKGE